MDSPRTPRTPNRTKRRRDEVSPPQFDTAIDARARKNCDSPMARENGAANSNGVYDSPRAYKRSRRSDVASPGAASTGADSPSTPQGASPTARRTKGKGILKRAKTMTQVMMHSMTPDRLKSKAVYKSVMKTVQSPTRGMSLRKQLLSPKKAQTPGRNTNSDYNRFQKEKEKESSASGALGRRGSVKTTRSATATSSSDANTNEWTETVTAELLESLPKQDILRQSIIHELFKLVYLFQRDVTTTQRVVLRSLQQLGSDYMSDEEHRAIFANWEDFVAPNETFIKALSGARLANGMYGPIGAAVLGWVTTLDVYKEYISRQVNAAEDLNVAMRTNKNFSDVLERYENIKASERLDLKAHLDHPRRVFQQYPLVLQRLIKCTPTEHADHAKLQMGLTKLEQAVQETDAQAGHANLVVLNRKLAFPPENKMRPDIDGPARRLLREGVVKLRDGDGYAVLLNNYLYMTKRTIKDHRAVFTVVRFGAMPLERVHVTLPGESLNPDAPATSDVFSGATAAAERPVRRSASTTSRTFEYSNSTLRRKEAAALTTFYVTLTARQAATSAVQKIFKVTVPTIDDCHAWVHAITDAAHQRRADLHLLDSLSDQEDDNDSDSDGLDASSSV